MSLYGGYFASRFNLDPMGTEEYAAAAGYGDDEEEEEEEEEYCDPHSHSIFNPCRDECRAEGKLSHPKVVGIALQMAGRANSPDVVQGMLEAYNNTAIAEAIHTAGDLVGASIKIVNRIIKNSKNLTGGEVIKGAKKAIRGDDVKNPVGELVGEGASRTADVAHANTVGSKNLREMIDAGLHGLGDKLKKQGVNVWVKFEAECCVKEDCLGFWKKKAVRKRAYWYKGSKIFRHNDWIGISHEIARVKAKGAQSFDCKKDSNVK